MSLADKIWQPVSFHDMAAAFLKAERHKFSGAALDLIDRADLRDAQANHRRLKLLYQIRFGLMIEIPPDTVWFRVDFLTPDDLPQLHVIARCGWDDAPGGDRNALYPAARRVQKVLQTLPELWPPVILWGHGKDAPLTIMEGNNRLAGYAVLPDPPPLQVTAYIGLSPTPCYYHLFDEVEALDVR